MFGAIASPEPVPLTGITGGSQLGALEVRRSLM
jgi:hypothetical protein